MRFSNIAAALAAVSGVSAAGRPENEPICDYYTKALLKENSAENQATLLTLLVNTVVIGNYTKPNVGVKVPGILAPGKVNGTDVNLAPYFSGALASSNRGGKKGVSVNFLDGGGAAPLMKNMPAKDKSSNQYFLLTHLYQFFGSLLGCSQQGMGSAFPAYSGHASMYEVHKFMDLNFAQVTYFIEQVGMAAASFGVATSDIDAVAKSLGSLFDVRCGPATAAIKAQGPQLQSICIDEKTCPKAEKADCSKYATPMMPEKGNSTSGGGSSGGSSSTPASEPTSTSSPSSVPTNGAGANGLSLAALAVGVLAFAL